jgi:type IV pilus assembly protein PilA
VLKQAIAECLQNNAGAATSCDSDVKLISQGFVPPGYVLPVPPFATGPVAISVATAAIVMTGNSAAGGCLVTLEPSSGPMNRMVDWRFTNAGGCNRGSTGVGT